MPFQVETTPTFGEDCLRAFDVLWQEREACRANLATPGERRTWLKAFTRKGELMDDLLDAYNSWREISAL